MEHLINSNKEKIDSFVKCCKKIEENALYLMLSITKLMIVMQLNILIHYLSFFQQQSIRLKFRFIYLLNI